MCPCDIDNEMSGLAGGLVMVMMLNRTMMLNRMMMTMMRMRVDVAIDEILMIIMSWWSMMILG